MNWMLVQDTFIALGNEVYLTIGNFNTDSTCGIVSSASEAYYYIDGVSVYDVATMGIEQIKNKGINLSLYPNPSNGKLYISNFDATQKM